MSMLFGGMDHPARLSPNDRVSVLLAEHQALYRLVVLRVTSLDRRVPISGAGFAAAIGAATVLTEPLIQLTLIGAPLALRGFMRATVNHARSFEDSLRRIEHIERRINEIADEALMTFQSSHPSRHDAVGGRTGEGTTNAALAMSLFTLGACAYLFFSQLSPPMPWAAAYAAFLLAEAVELAWMRQRLKRYRYEPTAPQPLLEVDEIESDLDKPAGRAQ